MTWKQQLILFLPAILAVALFCNALPGDFVFDDVAIIRDNPTIRTLAAPGRFFTSTYWEATGRNSGLYRPLTMLTYALNYALHGLRPAGYHLLNVLLHSINTLLVTWILLRLGGSLGTACVGAVLFAVHPIHVEAVANIVGRAELLAAFFTLAALQLYISAARVSGKHRICLLALSACAYAGGLFSKENAITFLALPVVYDLVWAAGRGTAWQRLRQRYRAYAGFVAITLLYLGSRSLAAGGLFIRDIPWVDNPLVDATLTQRLLTPFAIAGNYAWLMVWPASLSADYGIHVFPLVSSILDSRFLAGFALAGLTLAALWLFRNRSRPVCFLLLFAIVTYSIISNTVVLIGTIFAERLYYLSSVSVCGLAGIVIHAFVQRRVHLEALRPAWLAGMTLLLAIPLAVLTLQRNRDWHSEVSLYTTDVQRKPQSVKLNFNAGLVLLRDGQAEASIPFFEQCLRLHPGSERGMIYLGKAQGALGRDEARRRIYQQAAKTFGQTRHTLPAIGFLHMEDGEYQEAKVAYLEALELDPSNEQARLNLGLACYNLADYQGAVSHLQQAENGLEEEDQRQRLRYLGLALYALNRCEQAAAIFRQARRRFPGDDQFAYHEHLAKGQAAMQEKAYADAIGHLQQAISLIPEDPAASLILGMAYHNLGEFEKAVDILQHDRGRSGNARRNQGLGLGLSLIKLGRFQEAADAYRAALESLEGDIELLERLAYLEYAHLKEYPAARRHYEALLRLTDTTHPRRADFERVVAFLRRRAPDPAPPGSE